MNIYNTYFNNILTIFDNTKGKNTKSSQHSPKSSSYDDKTKAEITKIIDNYVKKEKSVTNLGISSDDILKLEDELIKRYNKDKSNNFPFPEIKNVLDCISDVLTYFKDNNYKKDDKMRWQIDQTINIIKNASQETICADIKIDKCPPEDTISTIKNAKDLNFFNSLEISKTYTF